MRFVIVATSEDGSVSVLGPQGGSTYQSLRAAERDAIAIELDYEDVYVLPIREAGAP